MSKVFALMDCNNFFASCERVFNPALIGKPIVVLSNNDGCIVARSNEAKALGIAMGAPYFKERAFLEKNGVHVFSSNYQLYGDMSQRVMSSLQRFAPDMEVYSIDEAFFRLDGFENYDLTKMSIDIRQKILQWTGIPTSIGIAPSKTLAKIANHVAKKKTTTGVFDMRDSALQEQIMRELPVEEIWGIAHRSGKKLQPMGIRTALDLRRANPKHIRKHFSVVGERIVHELNGFSCLDLEQLVPKKNIMSSRSFGSPVTELAPIEEALATYAARACEKLRRQKSKAQGITVYLRTNQFRKNDPQYKNSATLGFDLPTADTSQIIRLAKQALKQIYRSGYRYKKTGIMLLDLIPETQQQNHLFVSNHPIKSESLMKSLDAINHKMGKETVFFLAQGIKRGKKQEWQMRSDNRSHRYTTNWKELVRVGSDTRIQYGSVGK